jgi:hypothetical protein
MLDAFHYERILAKIVAAQVKIDAASTTQSKDRVGKRAQECFELNWSMGDHSLDWGDNPKSSLLSPHDGFPIAERDWQSIKTSLNRFRSIFLLLARLARDLLQGCKRVGCLVKTTA